MKALRFLQALAFLPACATTPSPAPQNVPAAPSASATSATPVATVDPTAGDGPCRCSWETNATSAPRVCKKGEKSHTGGTCVPGEHYPTGLKEGPLPPPDLTRATFELITNALVPPC